MFIDSHLHLDQFSPDEIRDILAQPDLLSCVAVATDLKSCQKLYTLKQRFPQLAIAAGFHPEQPLPSAQQIEQLFDWIEIHHHDLSAIGEVGLPHYLKRVQPHLDYAPYIALLERFIELSKRYDLPINLHIVYQDTEIALTLLQQYHIEKAHFHWFKADDRLLQQLLETPYFVSLTPDILWNEKTQKVAKIFPLDRLLIETDAPYPQQGFLPHQTSLQLHAVIHKIAELKRLSVSEVADSVLRNSQHCYKFSAE